VNLESRYPSSADRGFKSLPSAQRSGATHRGAPVRACGGLSGPTVQSTEVRAPTQEPTNSRTHWRTSRRASSSQEVTGRIASSRAGNREGSTVRVRPRAYGDFQSRAWQCGLVRLRHRLVTDRGDLADGPPGPRQKKVV